MHMQEQEQLIRELEERESFYSEQLRLLDMGVKISNWWKAWSWIIVPHQPQDESNEHLARVNTTEKTPGNLPALTYAFDASDDSSDAHDAGQQQ